MKLYYFISPDFKKEMYQSVDMKYKHGLVRLKKINKFLPVNLFSRILIRKGDMHILDFFFVVLVWFFSSYKWSLKKSLQIKGV